MLTLEVPSIPTESAFRPSLQKFTIQRTFILHTALLRQTFVHCAIFLTAASHRSLGRISVPVWLIILSDQLPIVALVGRYPANKLMGRGLILRQQAFYHRYRRIRGHMGY